MIGKDEQGLTLVEIIIALTVIVGAILGVASLLLYTSRLNESEREYALARQSIFSKIEEIKKHNFDYVVTDYSTGGSPGPNFIVTKLYNSQGTIYINSTNPNLLLITVTVSWQSVNGQRSISSNTLVTR
jgi:Tfp pilus assembly protein PilV